MANNIRIIQLETGPLSHEALTLYLRHGYLERGPFAAYEASPHGVFMEKQLPNPT
jgi:hypothetical protein